eukprot:TRINITY_DN16335_c0_g1_i1.p1 TRINITY_DN16335_c0_g1~~TRINITY_DN16335_c0_g1_i1.p1  ORF type:complete len:201 (+),score=76.55 TRINITY_DN16335_c0_g1_i1:66-668(+)
MPRLTPSGAPSAPAAAAQQPDPATANTAQLRDLFTKFTQLSRRVADAEQQKAALRAALRRSEADRAHAEAALAARVTENSELLRRCASSDSAAAVAEHRLHLMTEKMAAVEEQLMAERKARADAEVEAARFSWALGGMVEQLLKDRDSAAAQQLASPSGTKMLAAIDALREAADDIGRGLTDAAVGAPSSPHDTAGGAVT